VKKILRLYDDDIRNLVMEHYNKQSSEVTSVITDEVQEDGSLIERVYYVEVDVSEPSDG